MSAGTTSARYFSCSRAGCAGALGALARLRLRRRGGRPALAGLGAPCRAPCRRAFAPAGLPASFFPLSFSFAMVWVSPPLSLLSVVRGGAPCPPRAPRGPRRSARRPGSSRRRRPSGVRTRDGLPHFLQYSCTFETWIGPSFSMMPPWRCFCEGLVCRLMKFTFSTMTRCFSGRTMSTRPRLPFSLPAMTATVSFTLIAMSFVPPLPCPARRLEDFRRQRDDLHVPAAAQLAGHRPEDAGPEGLALGVDHDGRVAVEADVRAVRPRGGWRRRAPRPP